MASRGRQPSQEPRHDEQREGRDRQADRRRQQRQDRGIERAADGSDIDTAQNPPGDEPAGEDETREEPGQRLPARGPDEPDNDGAEREEGHGGDAGKRRRVDGEARDRVCRRSARERRNERGGDGGHEPPEEAAGEGRDASFEGDEERARGPAPAGGRQTIQLVPDVAPAEQRGICRERDENRDPERADEEEPSFVRRRPRQLGIDRLCWRGEVERRLRRCKRGARRVEGDPQRLDCPGMDELGPERRRPEVLTARRRRAGCRGGCPNPVHEEECRRDLGLGRRMIREEPGVLRTTLVEHAERDRRGEGPPAHDPDLEGPDSEARGEVCRRRRDGEEDGLARRARGAGAGSWELAIGECHRARGVVDCDELEVVRRRGVANRSQDDAALHRPDEPDRRGERGLGMGIQLGRVIAAWCEARDPQRPIAGIERGERVLHRAIAGGCPEVRDRQCGAAGCRDSCNEQRRRGPATAQPPDREGQDRPDHLALGGIDARMP